MSQIYKTVASTPSVAIQFTTDSGIAVPAANNLNVFGVDGASTSGAGDTITITVNGNVPNYVSVTGPATYVAAADDYFISCDATPGLITVQLPNAPTQYDTFVVKDRTGTASDVAPITITTVGGVVLIDGATSTVLDDPYDSIEVLFNGTSYEVY